MKKLLIAAVCFSAIVSMSSCTADDSPVQTKNASLAAPAKVTTDVKADDGGDDPTQPATTKPHQ